MAVTLYTSRAYIQIGGVVMGKASRFFGALRWAYLSSLVLGCLLLVMGGLLQLFTGRASASPLRQSNGFVYVAKFELPITPITAQYLERLISTAEDDGANALVIELDTPGGLVSSMQDIVKRMLASRVPIIVYVAPQGAMAASAGIFVVYASHVAAMAPNTTIGSAQVILNGGDSSGSATPESGDAAAERAKVTNLLVAQIRSLADERGRNADFAERAVRQSDNVAAQTAADQHIVDFIAQDVNDLLAKADGRTVRMGDGQQMTVKTKGAEVRQLQPTFAEELLILITDPNVAFVLISLGTLGITWEFINPGSVFPGVLGAIFLLTGFLALGTLPVNWAGAVFIVLAFVMFIADVFLPSHGILTAGGIASLVIGGLLLINTSQAPGIPGVSPYVVSGVATGLGLFFFFAIFKVVQARRMRPTTGKESLLGSRGVARTELAPEGMVFVEGELWQAMSTDGPIPPGRPVKVVGADGLTLKVVPEETQIVASQGPATSAS
jgi:membrane-bound serine protease (ClpP class)